MVSTSKCRGESLKEEQNFKRGSGSKAVRDNGSRAKDSGREKNSGEAAEPHKGQSGPRGYLIRRVREKARETVKNSKVGAAAERPMPAGLVCTLK